VGQLRKRGGVWWIRYYRNGRRFEESARSDKRQAAVDLLKIREGDVAKGVPISAKVGQLRFDEAAQDLITDYRVNKKKSLNHVQRRIDKALTPWFGVRRMAEITTADIRTFVDRRQASGAANGTINRELSALKRMFTLAVRAGKLMQRPHIPMLKENNARKGFFERAQFEAVRTKLPVLLRPIATFAYYTGWRTKSEILPLEWHRIDRTAGVIRLEPGSTKNGEGRVFKYLEIAEMKAAVDGLWAVHEAIERQRVISPYVFVRFSKKTQKARQIRNFRRAWLAACEAAGCPGRIPHDFRRTAVRNLTRAGVTETVAMKVTGHKTRSVFDRYDITSEEDLADASRKLQALAGTIAGTTETCDAEALRKILGKISGPPGDRTQDTVIKSHVLYH